MSKEIAFGTEEATDEVVIDEEEVAVFPGILGEKGEIAFSPTEAVEQFSRAERRRMQKEAEKNLPKKFVCPKCGYGERGGPTSSIVKMVDEKTGKLHEKRVPRYCRHCGGHMIKINDRRMTKKWVWKNAKELFL